LEYYRNLFSLVRPYWQRIALSGLLSLFISSMNGALAWLVKPAMDDVLVRKDTTMLTLIPVAIFLIFLTRGAFTYLNEYIMRSASQKMLMHLRDRLYNHVNELPLGFFSKNSSGELISRIINDTFVLHELVTLTIKDMFLSGLTVVVLTGVALWRRFDLTLIALLVLPVAFYGIGKLGRRIRLISRHAQEKISMITDFLNESFAGVKLIKAFFRQSEEAARFEAINRDYYRENMRACRVSEFASLVMEAVAGLGVSFVIWYGGRLIVHGAMTAGDFTSFLAAIFLIFTPAKRLAAVNIGFQQARAPLERIEQLFLEQKEADGTWQIEPIRSAIEFRNVSFAYPSAKHKALDGITLTIKKGEIIAIVGKSGGGKTTLVNLLPRFYAPTEGAIYIDETDISAATFKSLRGQFGIVSQEVILFNATIGANISYGKPDANLEEIVTASKAAYAHDFIMELSQRYDTVVGERGVKLSGGQRQRISIARAILKNPPILILDEATSSLDTASEMMVQKALENLMKNRTTLVIAHRISTVKRADRIIVLDRGSIAEAGSHRELYERGGIYRKLYDLQFSTQEVR
jgi:ATP-binding cassette, subfamily B, bacterial MsbA